MIKIVNLIGQSLTVAGVVIPAGEHRAVAPVFQGTGGGTIDTEYGALPVVEALPSTLADVRLQPGNLPFPEEQEDVIYLATLPVRDLAAAAGRKRVYGMGDRVSGNPADGVKNLVRPTTSV